MGALVGFFMGPFGKVAGIGIAIVCFFWWLKAHDAAIGVKLAPQIRQEMARELDEKKQEEWKTKEAEIEAREKASNLKADNIDRTLAALNASTAKVENEALRLKATNAERLSQIPGAVKAIPDPQLELEYRQALIELRMQEAQP